MPEEEELPDIPETLALIYEHSEGGPARQGGTSDSLDSKAFQSFSAASVVLGFGSFTTAHVSVATAVLYSAAGLSYILAGWYTFQIVKARNFRVTDAADRWWPSHRKADVDYARAQMLDDLAESANVNRKLLKDKGEHIKWLLLFVACEVVLVAAAVVVSLTQTSPSQNPNPTPQVSPVRALGFSSRSPAWAARVFEGRPLSRDSA